MVLIKLKTIDCTPMHEANYGHNGEREEQPF